VPLSKGCALSGRELTATGGRLLACPGVRNRPDEAEVSGSSPLRPTNLNFGPRCITDELSPDGQRLLTAGQDGIAKLFDATTGRRLMNFEPAKSVARPALTAASFSPDGTRVMTVSQRGEIRLYDAASGSDLGPLPDHGPYANAAWGVIGGRLVILTSDWDRPARLWDAQRRSLLVTYGSFPAGGAALSSDGLYVVIVEYVGSSQNYRLSVWDSGSGTLRQRSKAVGYGAWPARFAGTDSGQVVLFAADPDELAWNLVFWDWRKGPNALRTAEGWSREPALPVVSKNGRLVAAALDKRVRVYEADTANLVGETDDAPDWVNTVAFSPNGRWLATTGNDGRARVWLSQQINNRPVAELLGHDGGVTDVRFDPRSNWRLTTAGSDGTGRIWQLPERAVLPGTGHWMLGAEPSSDGRYLVTAEDNTRELRVYGPIPGSLASDQWREMRRITLNQYGRLIGVSFSPNGRKIVAVDEFSRAPAVWDWQSNSPIADLDSWKDLIGRPVVSADGRRVAAGDIYGKVVVWDLQSGKIVADFAGGGEGSRFPEVAAVPGSDWFADGGSDGAVRLWDPDRPEAPQQTLGTTGSAVQALEVSADGANLVSVAENHDVQIWRLSDGMLVQAFQGPPSTNSDVAFNQDGSFVAISAADAAVHIWRVANGQKLAVLQRHGDLINRVQFMRDGSLVTASDDSTVAVFPCPTCGSFPELLKKAQDRVQAHQR
jgi:WD40 repeat protein